jgi:Ras-related protein Rab-21
MLGKEIVLVIAGNKCDLEKQRVVSGAEAEQYAKDVGAHHFLTSAKQNKGINEMILNLTTRMMENDKSDDDSAMIRRPSKKGLIIDGADTDGPTQPAESGGCGC